MGGDYSRFTFNPKKNYSKVFKQQGRVGLDADSNEMEDITDRRFRAETLDIMGFNLPNKGWQAKYPSTTPNAFKITLDPITNKIKIGKGRMYVDGLMAECHGFEETGNREYDPALGEMRWSDDVPLDKQPYFFSDQIPKGDGNYLAYLDVWQREITAIEDPEIKEIALQGTDTATRVQTVWQVKLHKLTSSTDCSGISEVNSPPAGRMKTLWKEVPPQDDICEISAAGGYGGIENRLYRIEIHEPGVINTAKPAMFKWSKDNGSIAVAVEAIDKNQKILTLKSLGKDQSMRLNQDDWVEVIDDKSELESFRGEMARITKIDEQERKITLDRVLKNIDPKNFADLHTRVRKWDQKAELLPVISGPIEIESGIKIEFELDPANGMFNVGDYWVFWARTADGSIEPLNEAPPRGIIHHYAPLAVLTLGSNTWNIIRDCRQWWPIDAEQNLCCTVVIRPSDDKATIANAIGNVSKGGTICFLPDRYQLPGTIVISGSNIKIKGCGDSTIINGPSDKSPVFVLKNASSIRFESMQIAANPDQLAVDMVDSKHIEIYHNAIIEGRINIGRSSSNVSIRGNIIRGSGAVGETAVNIEGSISDLQSNEIEDGLGVSIKANDVRVTGNRFIGGRIWIRDDSSDISIRHNKILNGEGPGIRLGGLMDGEAPSNKEIKISNVSIEGNYICNLRKGGILADSEIDSIQISQNQIIKCALNGYDIGEPAILVSGTSNIDIYGNYIAENGARNGSFMPVVGIRLLNCEWIEIGHNVILNNGIIKDPNSPRMQGGIIIDNIDKLSFAQLSISDNLIETPIGPALVIYGLGQMVISGNVLSSKGIFAKGVFTIPEGIHPCNNDGVCVWIYNDSRDFHSRSFLFHGNQVSFSCEKALSGSAVYIMCHDISFDGNQVLTDAEFETASVILEGAILKTSGNRYFENRDNTNSKLCSFDRWALVTNNQADACIIYKGPSAGLIFEHNQMPPQCEERIEATDMKKIMDRLSQSHLLAANRLLESKIVRFHDLQRAVDNIGDLSDPRIRKMEKDLVELASNINDLRATQRLLILRSEMEPDDQLIQAKVVDQNGQPLEGLTVQLFDSQDNSLAGDITDEGGNIAFIHRKGAVRGLKGTQPQSYLLVKDRNDNLLYDSRKADEKRYATMWPEYLEIKLGDDSL